VKTIAGKYKIVETLGSGGGGVVYSCVDLDGSPVAIKEIHTGTSVALEVQALARLTHPNIVNLYDCFIDHGQSYLVMELVDGVHLRAYLDEKGKAGSEVRNSAVWKIVPQILQALDYLHGRGVVHGDIKPQNILVDKSGCVKITDFGLSRIGPLTGTEENVFSGTVQYASPEQCRGAVPDVRSDLYSLGIVLYEALSGVLPFEGETLYQVLLKQVQERPRSLSLVADWLESTVERTIMWLLEKNPADRLPSAREIWTVLSAAEEGVVEFSGQPAWDAPAELFRPAFMGRRQMLRELSARLDNVSNEGSGCYILEGEAGIGKSRLLEEFELQRGWEGVLVLSVQAGLGHGLPLDAELKRIHDRLERFHSRLTEKDSRRMTGGVGKALAVFPGWEKFTDDSAGPSSPAGAFGRLIQNIAEMCPVMICIDDLERMESAKVNFFRTALDSVSGVMTVVTREDAGEAASETSSRWIDDISSSGNQLKIEPLGSDNMKALICSMMGTMELPELFLERVVTRSGGNPALVQEVVRNAVENKALIYRDGQWQWVLKQWRYRKGSFRGKMVQRLGRLTKEAALVMEALAVSDPRKDINSICHVTGMNSRRFLDVLEECGRGGLVRRQHGELRVRHWVLLELVYSRMPAGRRREMHDLVASLILSDDRRDHSEIARHMALGNHPVDALPHYVKAIERLHEHAQYSAVTELAVDALRIAPAESDPSVLSILRHLGIAHRALGHLKEAEKAYRRLSDSADKAGAVELQMEALFGLAGIFYSTGQTDAALERFNQAVKLCKKTGNPMLEARCRLGAGVCRLSRGEYDQALKEAQRARDIFSSLKSPMSVARTLQLLGDIHHETGRFPQAKECNEKALEIFREQNQVEHTAACLMSIGRTLMEQGSIGRAEQLFVEAIQIAEKAKHFMIENISRVNLAGALIDKGEPWKAARELEKALNMLEQIGFPKTVADGLKKLAVAREMIGDCDRAKKEYERALEIYRNQDDKRGEADCLTAMGVSRLNQGLLDRAESLGNQVRAIARDIRDPLLAADCFELLGKKHICSGNTEKGHRFFKAALKLNRSFDRQHKQGLILCDMAFACLDTGDVDRAGKLFQDAGGILDSLGISGGMLRVLRGQYEMALKTGDKHQLSSIIERIHAMAHSLDDHAAIPHLFFRLHYPGFVSPLGEAGVKLARHIIQSTLFQNTPAALFALSVLAASAGSLSETVELYSRAVDMAQAFKMHRLEKQLRDIIHNLDKTSSPLTDKVVKEGKNTMKFTDSAPIQFLLHSTREFFTATDLNRLLTSVLDQVVEATGGERGFLMTRETDGELRFTISRNIQQDNISEPEFETSRSIINHVIQTGEPFVSGDVGSDHAFREQKSIQMLGLRSILCVPIPGNDTTDQAKGLIYLDNTLERGLFSSTDKLLVQIVAELASVALENVKSREAMAATQHALNEENLRLKEELGKRYRLGMLIGKSSAMDKVVNIASRVAASSASVLISGDTGTGKEIVAKTIHFNSPRKNQSFIGINCAALPENLLEAELFGIEKGVATGVNARIGLIQKADKGTLFLDEIADMSPATQAKILRVLQEREVVPIGSRTPRKIDVRIISATNKELKEEIRNGTFREDLFYRLNVIHINLPPLKDRKEDIVLLARHFLEKYGAEINRSFTGFTRETMAALLEYPWPGNVRELENAIQRATILETGDNITLDSLPAETGASGGDIQSSGMVEPDLVRGMNLKSNMGRVEKYLVTKAVDQAGGVKKEAAAILGITPRILSYYLKKHEMN
jgi:transcriptional regulator with GAF, ATPase, and Fis domain/tetratricopeptide (TPR) repeat protein